MSNGERKVIRLTTPLTEETVRSLHSGDAVTITGTIYTARDAAHKKFMELLDAGKPLPFDPKGQIIYYVGPTPAPPGRVIGSAGPTTSSRMDAYTPRMLALGIRGMIGKGRRSPEVKEAIRTNSGVYFAAVGGAAALLASTIKAARVVAFEELGPEAVRELTVAEFPAVVVNDASGGDLYIEGMKAYCTAP